MVIQLDEIKILCVDDEKNVLRSLQRVFMDEDFEIFTADSGDKGLTIIEENPDIALIISDYRMPGMNGVDFLKKAYEKVPATIRIVLSGFADTAAVVGAVNEGKIHKFIPKPWQDDELLASIKEAIHVYFLRQKNEQLADSLMEANDELTRLNEILEEQVANQTQDLEFQINAMRFTQNVMDALPAAVLGLTPDGLIVMGNKMSEVILSDSARSLVGMTAKQALPEDLLKIISRVDEFGSDAQEVILNSKTFTVRGAQIPSDLGQEGIVLMLDRK